MDLEPTNHPKTPAALMWIGPVFWLPSVIGLVTLPWQEKLRGHGLSSGFDEFLEAHHNSPSVLSTVALFYLASIVIGIGCHRGSPWVRWAIPALLGFLSVFGLVVGRPWDSVCGALLMLVALVYFFRSSRIANYFTRSEQGTPPNRA